MSMLQSSSSDPSDLEANTTNIVTNTNTTNNTTSIPRANSVSSWHDTSTHDTYPLTGTSNNVTGARFFRFPGRFLGHIKQCCISWKGWLYKVLSLFCTILSIAILWSEMVLSSSLHSPIGELIGRCVYYIPCDMHLVYTLEYVYKNDTYIYMYYTILQVPIIMPFTPTRPGYKA